MFTRNLLSVEMSEQDQKAALNDVAALREKLSFLIGLTVEQRQSLPKMGDKGYMFVAKALEVAQQNSGYLPRDFDIAEMERDVRLFQQLSPIARAVAQLNELLQDTLLAVSSDAYSSALVVYDSTKRLGRGTGLDAALSDMGRRFTRKPKTVSQPAEAPAQE